jgi:uncharacterized protein YecT (DUF1311 family)
MVEPKCCLADSANISDAEYAKLMQDKSFNASEIELNKAYKEYMKTLASKEDRDSMRKDQIQWLKYRNRDAFNILGKTSPDYVRFLTSRNYMRIKDFEHMQYGNAKADPGLDQNDVKEISVIAKPEFVKYPDGTRLFSLDVTKWKTEEIDPANSRIILDWTSDVSDGVRHCLEDAESLGQEVEISGTLLMTSFGVKYLFPPTAACARK